MATWTKSDLADRVLEYIGVKPAGQPAFAEHSILVQGAFDSVYDRGKDSGTSPYNPEAIPEWAQWPLVRYLAFEVGPRFGKMYPVEMRNDAKQEMAASIFGGPRGALPTKSKDY